MLLFKKRGGQNLILTIVFMLSVVLCQVKGQILLLDFNVGSEANCNAYTDWIENGQVYVKYPEIPVKSLSNQTDVHNFLTNDQCDTWIYAPSINHGSVRISSGNDRKLIVQKGADVAPFDQTSPTTSLQGQLGILLDIPDSELKDNYFYQIKYDMHQLFDTNCVKVLETIPPQIQEAVGTPTISLYYKFKYDSSDDMYGFIENNHAHNLAISSNSDLRIGEFTTQGLGAGIYHSDIFKFAVPDNPLPTSIHQIAMFVTANLAGVCDMDLIGEGGERQTLQESPMAALVDNVEIDCDQKNIAFFLDVTLLQPHELTSCAYSRVYKAELSTSCPNVDYNNFSYWITVTNEQDEVVRYVHNTGKTTYIDLDGLPDGTYKFKVDYDDSGGYNADVIEYIPDDSRQIQTVNHINEPYVVTGTEVFSDDAYMATDMIIMSGGHLTVSATLYMKDNHKIEVQEGGKLDITFTGHITACETQWFGVVVNGTGEVYSQGTLSKSKTGIRALSDASGKIHTEGAHFFDNEVVNIHVEGPTEISVKNTDILGGIRGVHLVNSTGGTTSNGVFFEGNQFSYQTNEGILAINTTINVRGGNQFVGCHEAIAMRNLFGSNVESFIGGDASFPISNEFLNCDIGVYANGSTQKIKNNIFNYCNNATWMSGLNGYESEFNSFTGGYNAEGLFGAGSESNISEHNDHSSSVYGIRAYFENNYYTFLSNCFNSAGTDVEAYGTISGAQGNENVAASNCFTHANYVQDLVLNTNHVLYYVPKPNITYPPCLDPVMQGSYIVVDKSEAHQSNQCGTSLSNPPIREYDYIKALGCDSVRLHNMILDYRRQLKTLLVKSTPLSQTEKAMVAWLNRHIRYLVNQWARCLRKHGKWTELYTWYREQEDKAYDIKAAEVKVIMGQYNDAISLLEDIQDTYSMDASVMDAILLNIAYVRNDIATPVFTPTQLNLLRSVASMSDPYAAYGRALLYVLTDEKIEPALPESNVYRSAPASAEEIDEIYTIKPNPASDIINITIDNSKENSTYEYGIMDLAGKVMLRNVIDAQSGIDISSMKPGMYFVQIRKDNIPECVRKIVILK